MQPPTGCQGPVTFKALALKMSAKSTHLSPALEIRLHSAQSGVDVR